jgi:hypothetical protein
MGQFPAAGLLLLDSDRFIGPLEEMVGRVPEDKKPRPKKTAMVH